MNPTLYVITNYRFNHHLGRLPLDNRFLASGRHVVFYLIDSATPRVLRNRPIISEHQMPPDLVRAGRLHLAEWSFLLAEAREAFCQYPFFVVSSRFYEKNKRLGSDLNLEWDQLFYWLDKYGWGYLPSYDRDWTWQDMQQYQHDGLLPVTAKGRELTRSLYKVDVPGEYRWVSDFFCNYIGFSSRQRLLDYVQFYEPLLQQLFTDEFEPREHVDMYVARTGFYRNEKPITFFLEQLSHLFFYKHGIKFFGLRHDGYYEVDEQATEIRKLDNVVSKTNQRLPRYTGAGYAPGEYSIRRLLAWHWSPMRLAFDGLLAIRLQKLFGRLRSPPNGIIAKQ